jgi:hypothetical protein
MRLTLDARWIDWLTRLPESGMGYQRVRVRLRNGTLIPRAVVLNAEVLEVDDPTPPFRAADIAQIELEAQ